MKILYHHRIASKDGQYVHIEEIVNALKSLGHEIIIVEPGSISDKQFGKSSSFVRSIRDFLPGIIHEWLEFGYCFLDFIKLTVTILKTKPDCIYERYNLFFPSGIWAKKLFRLPLILEVNAPLLDEREKHDGISAKKLALWTEGYVWRSADHVLPVTHVLAEIIKEKNVEAKKITVIPNGINKKKFSGSLVKSEEIKSKYQLGNKLVLGFTGFIREWHGLDKVIDVISSHKEENWFLFIVGDGPVREALEAQAKQLNITDRVSITGIVSRDDMAKYVSVFDIALQPDVVPYASPLKLFEYMASSKAILAPNRKNIMEILSDGQDSILFSPEKSGDFITKLEELCKSPNKISQLGKAALETIENKGLYWLENAKKIESLFLGLKKLPQK
jgi:glycosyltransferase involved in cell wall biosynthesis